LIVYGIIEKDLKSKVYH